MRIRQIILSTTISMLSVAAHAQKVEMIGILSHNGEKYVCGKVDPGTKTITNVELYCFNMNTGEKSYKQDYIKYDNGYYMFKIQTGQAVKYGYRMVPTFNGDNYDKLYSTNIEENGVDRFEWLGSDYKWTDAKSGYKSPIADAGIEGNIPFTVNSTQYYKGFTTHAAGYIKFDFAEDSPFCRFYTLYGIQDDRNIGDLTFTFTVNGIEKEKQTMFAKTNNTPNYNGPYIREFEYTIDGATTIYINGSIYDQDNGGDHMNFPMARVYYKPDARATQTIAWQEEKILSSTKPFSHQLEAKASSGLDIIYRISKGAEYASLEGTTLNITAIPENPNEYIEVEAFQPGNEEYKYTDLYRCRYYIRNNKTVLKNEKLVITDNTDIEELVVYGDAQSVGQVVVQNGLVKVNRLVLKYTFMPGKWNFITFPGEFNIDQISDLNSKGYYLNNEKKPYYICEYDTRSRAETPQKNSWKRLYSPIVKRNKGYIMGLARTDENDQTPVEITFTLDNTSLGTTAEQDGTLNVALNLLELEPEKEFPVYIQAEGVKSNILTVMMKFHPKDVEDLPLNFAKALEQARVTFNPNRSGIRLTLPESTPAKVLIFNKRGKLVKAVKYVSPHLIDIKDLKKGKYTLLVEYGNSQEFKELVIE